MKLMRAATLSVADLDRSVEMYTQWLDYSVQETSVVAEPLAASWGAPNAAGRRYAVIRPASGHDIYIRIVENDAHPDFDAVDTKCKDIRITPPAAYESAVYAGKRPTVR